MAREQQRQLKGIKELAIPTVNLLCHLHQGVRHPYSNALKPVLPTPVNSMALYQNQ